MRWRERKARRRIAKRGASVCARQENTRSCPSGASAYMCLKGAFASNHDVRAASVCPRPFMRPVYGKANAAWLRAAGAGMMRRGACACVTRVVCPDAAARRRRGVPRRPPAYNAKWYNIAGSRCDFSNRARHLFC